MLSDDTCMILRVYRYRGFDITAKYYGETRLNIIIAERTLYPACAIIGRELSEVKKDIDNLWREIGKEGGRNGN